MNFKTPIALHNLLATTILVLMTAQHALAAPTPIYNLGTLGGTFSMGLALNENGQVTGVSDGRAFLYSGTPGSGGTMSDLGTLPGGNTATGYAINASGQVTGNSGFYDTDSVLRNRAFLYTATPGNAAAMLNLGTLDGQPGYSYGPAINSKGQVAGWSTIADNGQHAFLYTGIPGNGGAMADLGVSRPYQFGFRGIAVNDSGQVAGGYGYDSPALDIHAFLYAGQPGHGGILADLGTLGGNSSDAYAINNRGQIAGWSYLKSQPNENPHAILYTGVPGHGGAMADLGTLGGLSSLAESINDNGDIVGFSDTTGSNAEHAFLYIGTPGNGGHMIDLDAWIDTTNPVEGAKWTLTSANGINDSGLIVGTGTYDDGISADSGTRAFLLDASALVLVPEPGSLWLLALGSAALLSRRSIRA